MKRFVLSVLIVFSATWIFVGANSNAQRGPIPLSADVACKTLKPTSMGGVSPQRPTTLVLRWLGTSNYELAYRNTVLLFDSYYSMPPRARPLGFKREDIKRADALLMGHAHYDHIADAKFLTE